MLVILSDQRAISPGDRFMRALFPGLSLGALYIVVFVVFGLISSKSMPGIVPDYPPLTVRGKGRTPAPGLAWHRSGGQASPTWRLVFRYRGGTRC